MNVIVIGASGFIGNYIYNYSEEIGNKCVGTYSSRYKEGLIKYDILTDSILDNIPYAYIKESDNSCAVICSSMPKIDACHKEKKLSYGINVKGTIKLLEELNSKGIKPVFLSTDCVFDGEKGYYDEHDDTSPVNDYGRQKVEVEEYILSRIPNGLIIRLSKIVGDDPRESHMFSEWHAIIQNNKPILCIEGLTFTPTYVKDVAVGIQKAIEKNLRGVYHLANPEIFERYELARQFSLITGTKAEIVKKPLKEFGFSFGYPLKTYLDSSKFRMETNMLFTSMKQVINNFYSRI